jgi:hypothetical protein
VHGLSTASAGEDEDADEFFSSLGFEFVDARPGKAVDDHDGSDAFSDSKSHIDCHLFLLSGSMQQHEKALAIALLRMFRIALG